MRGFFPPAINIMALTATASQSTRKAVCRTLGLHNPVYVVRSPDKPNIVYTVSQKPDTLDEAFAPLLAELRNKRIHMDRTMIFCSTLDSCSKVYKFFKQGLGNEVSEPMSLPHIPKYRIMDMYTSCTTHDIKASIIKTFGQVDGKLRLLIATVAFGMGLDCPNVRRIIHWGPPSNIESYIQETGRSGRDGKSAHAILYYSKADIGYNFVEEGIRNYCTNKDNQCRRQLLFADFEESPDVTSVAVGCKCCDVCSFVCECIDCAL